MVTNQNAGIPKKKKKHRKAGCVASACFLGAVGLRTCAKIGDSLDDPIRIASKSDEVAALVAGGTGKTTETIAKSFDQGADLRHAARTGSQSLNGGVSSSEKFANARPQAMRKFGSGTDSPSFPWSKTNIKTGSSPSAQFAVNPNDDADSVAKSRRFLWEANGKSESNPPVRATTPASRLQEPQGHGSLWTQKPNNKIAYAWGMAFGSNEEGQMIRVAESPIFSTLDCQIDFLRARFRSTKIVAVVPKDAAEFENMFGHRVLTRAVERELELFVDDINSGDVRASIFEFESPSRPVGDTDLVVPRSDATWPNLSHLRSTSRAYFDDVFTYSSSKTIVVSGHSVPTPLGRALVLPDGTKLPFHELKSSAAKHGKNCVLVSCYSDDLGLRQTISFQQAGKLIKAMNNAELADEYFAVVEFLKREHRRLGLRRKVKVTVIVGIGAGLLYEVTLGED